MTSARYPTDPDGRSSGVYRDFRIAQGADWPGEQFWIVDGDEQPAVLDPTRVTGEGWIGEPGKPIYRWSTNPAAGEGPIVVHGDRAVVSVPAAHTLAFRFTSLPYQVFLTDPAAPAGQRTIRIGHGVVHLDRRIAG